MGNKAIIEAINEVAKSFSNLASVLADVQPEESVKETPKKSIPMNKPEETPKVTGDRAEELRNMKYNDMKKLASSLGVSAAGKRDDIIARIIEAENSGAEPEETTEEVKKPEPKKAPGKITPISSKLSKKEAEPDEFDELAKEVLEENGVEAVIEELANHDIKANKKNALELLAKGLREGVISLDDEEEETKAEESEEEETEAAESEEDEGEDVTPETYFADYDESGVNDPSSNSEARVAGMQKVMEEQISAIEDEDIDVSDMKAYLDEISTDDEKKEMKEWEDDDFVAAYLEAKKRMVDDDGDVHEPSDAYQIGENYFCCGHELVYDKKSKEYICPVCEQTYEA